MIEVEHILRPCLPWRAEERVTECGRQAAVDALTRDQAIAKIKAQGKTRAAMTTCMTCWGTAGRWPDWAASPSSVMARYAKGLPPSYILSPEDGSARDRMDVELRALAALVEAHQDEFDSYVEGALEAPSLATARAKRARGRR